MICPDCRGEILYVREPRCMRCGKPLKRETEEYCPDCREHPSCIRQGRSVWLHRGKVPGAIYRFKYHNRRRYGKVFASEMMRCCGDELKRWRIGLIIPVPLHPSRKRVRGYNQAEILADELSLLTGIPARNDILYRIKRTSPQKKLDGSGRRKNLRGAFAVKRGENLPQNVLLIDDIYTTGSTVERCAKMLRLGGVQNVYFLTVSIGQGI